MNSSEIRQRSIRQIPVNIQLNHERPLQDPPSKIKENPASHQETRWNVPKIE